MHMNWDTPTLAVNEWVTQINGISMTMKREDLLHPHISGNKWRKLKYNLRDVDRHQFAGIATFGGAYSNHLVATARAGRLMQLPTWGFVRGDELAHQPLNPTLDYCVQQGMQLVFLSRSAYAQKEASPQVQTICAKHTLFLLPEGGTNPLAVKGCEEIITAADAAFDTVCCAVGTGGTLKGILNSLHSHQQAMGFVTVNDATVTHALTQHAQERQRELTLIPAYATSRYGTLTNDEVAFINDFTQKTKIPLDPIYTGKMLFGIFASIERHQWTGGKNVLMIHTGGLQGIAGFNARQKAKGKPVIVSFSP